MKVSGNSKEYQHPTPGTVNAVCTRVIDLGTQTDKTGKSKRKVMLAWEIAQLMDDQRPFLVTARFPANISPKAMLGQFLETWRGVPFTDEELEGFDLVKLLGAPCLLTLLKEGDYTNVKGAMKLIEGIQRLEPNGPLVHFDLDNFSQEVFDKLSDSVKETIKKSPEYTHKDDVPGTGGGTNGVKTGDIPF